MNTEFALKYLASMAIQMHVIIRELEGYFESDGIAHTVINEIHDFDESLCAVLVHLRQRYMGYDEFIAAYPGEEWFDDTTVSDDEIYTKCRTKLLSLSQQISYLVSSIPIITSSHTQDIQNQIKSLDEFRQQIEQSFPIFQSRENIPPVTNMYRTSSN